MIDGNIDVVSLTGDITDSVSLEGELLPIGPKGDKGDPGFSPVVTSSKSGKTTTVKFETATGNVYAYIQDGEDGQGSGDMLTDVYDQNKNGIVDNAEKVNNHTVEKDVPANADFSDTKAIWGNITGTLTNQTDLNTALGNKANTSDLSTVATSGSYNDLSNKPTNVSTFTNDANYVTSNGNAESTQTNVSSATFTNTLEAPMNIDLKGNTLQNGTPTPSSPIPINNVSGDNQVVVYNNLFSSNIVQGNVTATGADTNTDRIRTEEHIKVNPSTKYKISFDSSIGINRYNVSFYNGINYTRLSETGWLTDTYFTTPSNCNYILVAFSKSSSGAIVPSNISNVMMNFGENSLPYTPYETPQTYNIDLPVENLFDKTIASKRNSNASNSQITNGIKISPAGNNGWCLWLIKDVSNYVGKKFSTRATFNGGKIAFVLCDANGYNLTSGVDTSSSDTNLTYTIPTLSNATYLAIQLYGNSNNTNEVSFTNIMVNEGATANSYTPYGTTPIELNKIGTYQDYIYKENDKWYLHKEIGKVVLDTLTWFQESNASSKRYHTTGISNLIVKPPANNKTLDTFSNIYIKNNATWTWQATTGKGIGIQMNGDIVVFDDSYTASTDLTNFTTMLSNKNAILYYPLATPTNTEITYTPLIEQLESIKNAMSKEGITNVNQVNNDLPFILDLSVFIDTYDGRYESLVERIPSKDNLVNVGTSVDTNYRTNILYSHNLLIPDTNSNAIQSNDNTTYTFKGDLGVKWYGYIGYFEAKANTTYTIKSNSAFVYGRLGLCLSANENCKTTNRPDISIQWDASAKVIKPDTLQATFTSNANQRIYLWYCSDENNANKQAFTTSIQINEGSTALSYEPYVITSINIDGEEIYNANLMNYSTNEQRIGTWIDGKTIYRKVITITSINTSANTTDVSISLPSLNEVVNIGGSVRTNGGQYKPIVSNYIDGNGIQARYIFSVYTIYSTNLTVSYGDWWKNVFGKANIIIEYTKTTD